MNIPNREGGQPAQNVFALFEAAAANSERPFLVTNGATLLTYGAMLDETGRAAAWLDSVGVARRDRGMVKVHKSAAAVICDLPSASVFMGVPTFYTRLLTEETP